MFIYLWQRPINSRISVIWSNKFGSPGLAQPRVSYGTRSHLWWHLWLTLGCLLGVVGVPLGAIWCQRRQRYGVPVSVLTPTGCPWGAQGGAWVCKLDARGVGLWGVWGCFGGCFLHGHSPARPRPDLRGRSTNIFDLRNRWKTTTQNNSFLQQRQQRKSLRNGVKKIQNPVRTNPSRHVFRICLRSVYSLWFLAPP